MPITITTLNDNAAAARNYTELGKDRSYAQWRNTSDSTTTKKVLLTLKSRVLGSHAPNGSPIRQASFLSSYEIPVTAVMPNGNSKVIQETIKCNITITAPEQRSSLTDTDLVNCVAFAKNAMTGTNALDLVLGMV